MQVNRRRVLKAHYQKIEKLVKDHGYWSKEVKDYISQYSCLACRRRLHDFCLSINK